MGYLERAKNEIQKLKLLRTFQAHADVKLYSLLNSPLVTHYNLIR